MSDKMPDRIMVWPLAGPEKPIAERKPRWLYRATDSNCFDDIPAPYAEKYLLSTPAREHAEEAVALLMEMKWEVARLHNENGSIAAKYHNLFKYLATIEAKEHKEEIVMSNPIEKALNAARSAAISRRNQNLYDMSSQALTALRSGELVVVPTSTLLKIRDALIAEDYSEAYHQLYLIADPDCIKYEPWKEWEDAQRREEEENGNASEKD